METKNLSEELEIKLLWDLSHALPTESHTTNLLRSFYLNTCKRIGRRDVKLPAMKFAPSVMCPKCSSTWSEGKFSLNLKPQRFRTQKAQKLVDTLKSDPKSLTKSQRTRAKWLKKRVVSSVEIKCEFCQKKTLQPLMMGKKAADIEEKPTEKVVEVQVPNKKKKKKKGKDKTAGLKLDRQSQKEKLNPFKKTVKPIMHATKVKATQVVSKTQKQNSLLQLANMLKNQGSAVKSKGNNQLENFLR